MNANATETASVPDTLRALRRGLQHAQGFALFVAVCDNPADRDKFIALLSDALPGTPIEKVELSSDSTDPLDAALRQLNGAPKGPIMLIGIERAIQFGQQTHPVLHALNLRRPEWPERLPQPIVFWVPGYALELLGREAPDFLDWRSDTFHFPPLTDTGLAFLQPQFWTARAQLSVPLAVRRERVRELQSRLASLQETDDPVVLAARAGWLRELAEHAVWLDDVLLANQTYLKVMETYAAVGGPPKMADLCVRSGVAHFQRGRPHEAIESFRHALSIARDKADRRGEGNSLGSLGLAYADLGQVEEAIELHNEALAIHREIGDRQGEGTDLGNLGLAYARVSQFEKAIDYYEQALAIAREIADRHGEGNHLGNLGVAYARIGQLEKAIEYHQQALAIGREIGDRQGQGADLGNLATAYGRLGHVEMVIEYCEQALAIAREVGDRRGETNHLGNLGLAYASLGQVAKARDYLKDALRIACETKDPVMEATVTQALQQLK